MAGTAAATVAAGVRTADRTETPKAAFCRRRPRACVGRTPPPGTPWSTEGVELPDSIDQHVVVAARRGDGDAFAIIWRELSPAVRAYVAARGALDPDEVTSDVFLAVLPRLAGLTGGVAGLRTFVFSVAHARLVDEMRRRARRPVSVEFDPHHHDGVVDSAEQHALQNVATAQVYALLDRLEPDYREVLALRVLADLGVGQTAKVMGRSAGAVKQLQRRALLALRAQLNGHGVTDGRAETITDSS